MLLLLYFESACVAAFPKRISNCISCILYNIVVCKKFCLSSKKLNKCLMAVINTQLVFSVIFFQVFPISPDLQNNGLKRLICFHSNLKTNFMESLIEMRSLEHHNGYISLFLMVFRTISQQFTIY